MTSNSILNFGSYDFYILWAITFGFLISFSIFGKEKIKIIKILDTAFICLLIALCLVMSLDVLAFAMPKKLFEILRISNLEDNSSNLFLVTFVFFIKMAPILLIIATWIFAATAFDIKIISSKNSEKDKYPADYEDKDM